ncbi:hypothetical protein [Salinibius halmophilus]|uniref:hypothetical protein n=1 Tax=Salinibius halmophilus TaxID=1853216 RepID=UPI000E6624E7|nr:hypothetical protein [Salinibius halmophilus]
MKQLAYLGAAIILTGCASRPPMNVQATYLTDSPRHTIVESASNGASQIKYAGYVATVDKDTERALGGAILADIFDSSAIAEERTQNVSLRQVDPMGEAVTLNYQTLCSASGFRLSDLGLDTVDVDKNVKGTLKYQGTTWQIADNTLRDVLGNEYKIGGATVTHDGEILLEYFLDAYVGGFSSESYVWLNQTSDQADLLLATTLLNYTLSFEPIECGE